MSSRYDYRDPGTDPAYCNGLSPDEPALMGLAQPKPPSRLYQKIAARLEILSKAREFRRAVWARDKGQCWYCHRRVRRTIEMHPLRGEVHHLRGRRCAPEHRYDPRHAVLLCLEHHQQAQRHEITLVQPLDWHGTR